MCGLCGIARHPKAEGLPQLKVALDVLLLAMERRGHHATGLAVVGGSDPFLWKTATEASKVVKSEAWAGVQRRIRPNARVLLGHTRHATLNNAGLDEAAHPFKEGVIVGAHNGMIWNWQEVARKLKRPDLIVDSQVVFAALQQARKPEDALDLLDGWWALTWTKNTDLHVTRTADVPLCMAYVPDWRALVWASTEDAVKQALREAKAPKHSLWEPKPKIIYRYATNDFTSEGTGVLRQDVAFRGKTRNRPGHVVTGGRRGLRPEQQFGGHWDRVAARETVAQGDLWTNTQSAMRVPVPFSKTYSLREIDEDVQDLRRRVELLEDYITMQDGRIESQKAEIDYLFAVLNEANILDDLQVDPDNAAPVSQSPGPVGPDVVGDPADEADAVTTGA